MNCHCGSEKPFTECCEPVIKGERVAATAEELMRARYSAFVVADVDFLTASMHPNAREDNDPEATRDWAENSKWLGLQIVGTQDGGEQDETGEVEFIASFEYGGEFSPYHEVGHFEKLDGAWYFKEGEQGVNKPVVRSEPRVGRNDPCPCGSGRKFKRCCGA